MMRRDSGHLTGIGEELRQARIRRGRSIAQANQATRIARHYLEAFEDEDWSQLPAAPFARGFLSSYAQYLGLDDGPLLERFPLSATSPGDGLQMTDETIESYQALERSGAPGDEIRPSRIHLGPWLAAAVVILVIIIGVVAVVNLRDEVEPVETTRDVPGIDNVSAELESTASSAPIDSDFEPLPDLTLFPSRQAINHVKLLNVPYVVIRVYDDSEVGTVLEQSPAAGAEPDEDAVVTLVVSRGPRPGLTSDSATDNSSSDSEPTGGN